MGKWSNIFIKEKVEERYILSLDGGGVRGIVPSIIIKVLSSKLKDDIPFYAHFDLIAGTSTGGLIALALTSSNISLPKEDKSYKVYENVKKGFFKRVPTYAGTIVPAIDPTYLESIYLEKAKDIFYSSKKLFGSVFSDKYDSEHLEAFLQKSFSDSKLSDALCPTLVVSYDSIKGQEVILSSYGEYSSMSLVDAARATSAAPLYFAPKNIYTLEGEKQALIDGGVIANNPALYAYIEARKLYPNCKKFHILSISTARSRYSFDPLGGGITSWAEPLAKIYPNAQMELIDRTLSSLSDVEYTRIHSQITKEKISMDDTRNESLLKLSRGATEAALLFDKELEAWAAMLRNRNDYSHVKLNKDEILLLN